MFSEVIDGWKSKSPNFKVSDDKRTVLLVDNCWGTVCGDIKLNSMSNRLSKWNLKLKKQEGYKYNYGDLTTYITLGVTGAEPRDEWYDTYSLPDNVLLCCGHPDHERNVYGPSKCIKHCVLNEVKWGDGDIVGIKLDLKERNIEYFVNYKSVGITHTDIPIGEDIYYRLAITMTHDGNSVIFVDHQFL